MTSALFQIKRKKKAGEIPTTVGWDLCWWQVMMISSPLPCLLFFFIQNFTFLIVIFK
jgi:hypothetical protein